MKNSDLFWALNDLDEDLIQDARGESRRKPARPWRTAVLVAAAAVVLAVTAGAVSLGTRASQTWDPRQAAREDLGLEAAATIPEYTEYPLAGEPLQTPTLVCALCSGGELTAYLQVPDVTETMAAREQAAWDGELAPAGISSEGLPVKVVRYDPASGTALVKVTAFGAFDGLDVVALKLTYASQSGAVEYPPVQIPLTASRTLEATPGLALPKREPGGISACVTAVQVRAGYLTLCLEAAPCAEFCEELGPDAWTILEQAADAGVSIVDQTDAEFCYAGLIKSLVNEAAADLTLELADGTCLVLDRLPRLTEDLWVWPDSLAWAEASRTGRFAFQCRLAGPLDLDQIRAVTIGSETHPFEPWSK